MKLYTLELVSNLDIQTGSRLSGSSPDNMKRFSILPMKSQVYAYLLRSLVQHRYK